MTQPGLFDSSIEARFQKFHAENPRVYELFKTYAYEAMGAGVGRVGAKALIERIRWQTMLETRGEAFKLNNNFTSRYARLLIQKEPCLAYLLETRSLKA